MLTLAGDSLVIKPAAEKKGAGCKAEQVLAARDIRFSRVLHPGHRHILQGGPWPRSVRRRHSAIDLSNYFNYNC